MLDLGVWMALQSKVECIHRGKVMQSDELSKSVHQAFSEISEKMLINVYERWKLVLKLIQSGKGTNELVEEHRRKLNRSLLEPQDLPTIPDNVKLDGYCEYVEIDSSSDEDGVGSDEEEIALSGQQGLEKLFDDT